MQNPELTYSHASRELLDQASRELAAGDVRQATEKGWGAAAQMVKAVASRRGWQHNSHSSALRCCAQVGYGNRGRRYIYVFSHGR